MWNVSARQDLPAAPPVLVSPAWCPNCGDDLCYYVFPFSCYLCRGCSAYWPLQHALEGKPGFFDDSARCSEDCSADASDIVTVFVPHSADRRAGDALSQ